MSTNSPQTSQPEEEPAISPSDQGIPLEEIKSSESGKAPWSSLSSETIPSLLPNKKPLLSEWFFVPHYLFNFVYGELFGDLGLAPARAG